LKILLNHSLQIIDQQQAYCSRKTSDYQSVMLSC